MCFFELHLQVGRQAPEVGNAPAQDLAPCGGKRLAAYALPTPLAEQRLAPEPGHRERGREREQQENQGARRFGCRSGRSLQLGARRRFSTAARRPALI